MIIESPRVRLRSWRDSDRAAFAAMNADPEVMRDLGGPISTARAGAKFDRHVAAWDLSGLGRWLIETRHGDFLGYTGVLASHRDHPLGAHFEAGWRLVRSAWGNGYATEATKTALADAFSRLRLTEALAYTAPDNLRSQNVMQRLELKRDTSRDFDLLDNGTAVWRGLVWVARPWVMTACR